MSESVASPLTLLAAWRRQRFQHALFVTGAGVLVLASSVGTPPMSWLQTLIAWGSAWLLLAGFRLGDDLLDRHADAVAHPDRVLTHVTDARTLWLCTTALLLCGCLGIAWLSGQAFVAIIAIAACCVFSAAYARNILGGVSEAIILLKYPAIVLALSSMLRLESIAVMLLIYGVMCIDEAPNRPSFRPLAIGACSVSAVSLLVLLESASAPFAAIQVALIVVAALGFWQTFGRANTLWMRLGWMAWVVIQLVNFDLGHP